MNQPTDWVSAIAILAGGLILGLLVVFYFSRRKSGRLDSDPALRDLEAKRDALVRQLRDLDENTTPAERHRLERETADVLRALDLHASPVPPSPRAPASSAFTINPAMKGFLWGAGSFAALAALFFFVMQQSNPRQQGMEATGAIPGQQQAQQQQQPQQAAQPDPLVMQLEAAVAKDPNNDTLRNDLARVYLDRENLMGVFEQTKVVLARNPNDPRALTLNALVRMAMGEPEIALQMLEKSTRIQPKELDSWVALAWVYAQSGKMKEAERAIAEAAKVSPKDKARLDMVFAQMKQHASGQPSAVAEGELPAGHPPVDGAPAAATPAAPAAAGAANSVTVTIDLDPAATQRTGILFIMARNPGGGPPVAVKRLMAANFPMTLQFGAADSMMGQPLPATFRLEARLDSDGDAATKPPTDPAGRADNVAPGMAVKLALK